MNPTKILSGWLIVQLLVIGLIGGVQKGLKHQIKHRERPTVWRPIKGMLMQGI